MAGRDRARLDALGLNLPVLVTDSRDASQLDDLAARTHVVLNMASPFRRYGDPLVEACIRNDAHYCDISGETARIRDLIDRHHATAAARQLRIVPFCGASSAPVDVAVYLLASRLGGSRPEVKASLRLGGGGVGEGTITSIGDAVDSGDAVREANRFLLGPDDRSPSPVERDPSGIRYDRDLRAWTIASPLGVSDTRAVRRSAVLSGRDVVFQEYLVFPNRMRAAAMWFALAGFRAALRWHPTRSLLGRLARCGGKQPETEADAATYDVRVGAKAADGRRIGVRVHGEGDASHRITVLCACESALAMATSEPLLPKLFGVLTPSTALGDVLFTRLRAAGMKFEFAESRLNNTGT